MSTPEGERLAGFSRAVRESTLKRLHQVPVGSENRRPTPEAMSFADLAQHLIDADNWLFKMLELKSLKPVKGRAGLVRIVYRSQYEKILNELEQTGVNRANMLETATVSQFDEMIFDERFGCEVTSWWIIVRGNLDHEIHHRGQIATYLRIISSL